MLGAILQFLASLLGFIPKSSPIEKVTRRANDMAQESAIISRETQNKTDKDLDRVENETNFDVERLNAASSLRERVEIARNAVKRANKEPGASD